MSGKFFKSLKENKFYFALLSAIVVITLILTITSLNEKPDVVEQPQIDLNQPVENQVAKQQEDEDKVLEDDPNIDMESVVNLEGDQELGENLLIVKDERADEQAEEANAGDLAAVTSSKEEEKEEIKKTGTFAMYDSSQEMKWPVMGNVVMPYNMETVIYDETLDCYRTNDTLRIAGGVGDRVSAVAEGRVISIEKNEEDGTVVAVEHGNNWISYYSQLSEVKVNVNDIVKATDTIGFIGEPTMFTSSLGAHVGLMIKQDDEVTDPIKYMEPVAEK